MHDSSFEMHTNNSGVRVRGSGKIGAEKYILIIENLKIITKMKEKLLVTLNRVQIRINKKFNKLSLVKEVQGREITTAGKINKFKQNLGNMGRKH